MYKQQEIEQTTLVHMQIKTNKQVKYKKVPFFGHGLTFSPYHLLFHKSIVFGRWGTPPKCPFS